MEGVQSEREFRVGIYPNLEVQLEYTPDHSAITVTVEYRRDGEWESADSDRDRHGQRVTITRDGTPLLEQEVSFELLERYGTALAKFTRRFTDRQPTSTETAEPESWPIAVTQEDGSVIKALRPPTQATFELYEDHADEWRWRLIHQNGNIIADCGEGYSSKRAALNGIESVKRNALGAPTEEQ